MKIVLASTSPRRREILELLKVPFEVCAPTFEESSASPLSPTEEVCLFAREKAFSLKDKFPDSLLIGSDTLVKLAGKKFGKPKNPQEAAAMLRQLSGNTHEVLTAMAVLNSATGKMKECLSVAYVRMKVLSDQEISDYISTGEPLDKAGAYAVQGLGAKLIESVDGDYFTVVGLPLQHLAEILKDASVKISVDVEAIYSASGSQKVNASK